VGVTDHLVGSGKSRERYASVVLFVALAFVPLAYASPPDPTWIPGVYDAADYDDAVWLLTDTTFAREGPAAAHVAFPAFVRLASCDPAQVHLGRTPSALHPRAPPQDILTAS